MTCSDPTSTLSTLSTLPDLSNCSVSVYAPEAFKSAGYSSYKSDLLSGCNDISYIASVRAPSSG